MSPRLGGVGVEGEAGVTLERSVALVTADVRGDWDGNMFLLENSSLWRLSCWGAAYLCSESGGARGLGKLGDMLSANCAFACMSRAF